MKYLISSLALLMAFSGQVSAKEKKKSLSEVYEEKGYHYSALNEFFMETHNKPITVGHVARLEGLLYYTGIEILEDYDTILLKKYPSSSIRFILGRKAIHKNKIKEAIEFFDLIHKDHRYYPESRMVLAEAFAAQGNTKKQFETYEQCQATAERLETAAPVEKIKRYYRMIYENCVTNRARHYFKLGEYQKSLDAYNEIPKVSYKWPYLLLEKAWVYYQMGDYNRTLGLLMTYKSPLLDTYFFPEAEYLTALAYYRLCLYEDSLVIVNQYYEDYRPRFADLESVLRQNRGSQTYFYDLMFKPGDELKKHKDFVRQIITRLKKQTRMSLDFNTVYKINKEMRDIGANENKATMAELLPHLAEVRSNQVSKVSYNSKADIFRFLETVPFFSSELFKLNLEIIARKKDLLYANKRLVAERSRGDLSNVKKGKFEYFWKFHGAFWADELGDYSLGLQSNCQTIRNEADEE